MRGIGLLVACGLAAVGCSTAASSAESHLTSSTAAPVETTTSAVVVTVPSTTTTIARPPAVAAVPDAALVADLEHAWSRAPAQSCLMVMEGGRVVYEHNPDLPVTPASTQKLLTATGVLAHMAAGTRFHTPVLAAAAPHDGQLDGDLYLVGTGDPTLVTAPYMDSMTRRPAVGTSMELLADRVVAAGVRHVTGRVLADDSRFDDRRSVPGWPARYFTDGEIGTLSALTVNDGLARWEPEAVPFPDAAIGAASVLVDLLRARGVQIDGDVARAQAPAGLVEVAGVDSATTGELVADMVRESDNTTAELLLKELGRRVAGSASTEAGTRVVSDTLRAAGVPLVAGRTLDGSGLSRDDRVTCRTLVSVVAATPSGSPIDAGLPVAGVNGTLLKRMVGTPAAGRLRAKTGSILHVMALAGRAAGPGGTQRTFAFVLNDLGSTTAGKVLEDEVAVALVTR